MKLNCVKLVLCLNAQSVDKVRYLIIKIVYSGKNRHNCIFAAMSGVDECETENFENVQNICYT